MQSVRRHTSIPVPRPWCTFRWGGDAFLVMQKVSGAPLYASLWDTFTEEEKYKVVEQLRGFVQQIRAIPPRPGAVIGPVLDGAQSSDHRLCGVPHGPYLNEDQMNHQLRMGLPLHRFPSMVIESHSRQHPLVFTHGDIAMRNMMLEGRRVVVLIDWEGAGWYPAHWEY
ncbi:kinase-like protein, partial [Stereum hirsutum FP-91666 SS1]|uniref:kinase-like protein n=1 Tax=Stereum hirsutum (strain FP-91666) TaxID=721885 RepID=UPI000444A541